MAIDTKDYIPQILLDEDYLIAEWNNIPTSRLILIVEEDLVDKIDAIL